MMQSSVQVKEKMAGINADIESTLSGMKTSKGFLAISDSILSGLTVPMRCTRVPRPDITRQWDVLTRP